MTARGRGEGTVGHPVRAVRSSTGATGSYVSTPPPAAGSQSVLDRDRAADPRPSAVTVSRRCRNRPYPAPIPVHRPSWADSRTSAPGQVSPFAAVPGWKGISTASRLRARAANRRTSPGTGRAGGRSATMSTASSRAPTAVVQLVPGWGTMASRWRSRPYSTAASALMVGRPTRAHHAPSADAAEISASSSDTDPPTLTVLPRRRPSGSRGDSAGWIGNAGATRRVRSTAVEPSSLRTATSSISPFSNMCSTASSAWHPSGNHSGWLSHLAGATHDRGAAAT